MNKKKLTIGFITYGKSTSVYLPYFLESLRKQDYKNFSIFAVDCTEDGNKDNLKILSQYSNIKIIAQGKNLGFAKSYNLMIAQANQEETDYFLALNPDMILEPDAIEILMDAVREDENSGSFAPMIYRWNFVEASLRSPEAEISKDEKSRIIDSAGIVLKNGLRFYDLGQGEIDSGQYKNAKILGPSGAAALYRMDALEKVKVKGQYFDERMFMYKEDCDLAYRLFLAGYSSRIVPDSIIYHDRTASAKGLGKLKTALNRKNKNRKVKIWSLENQLLIFRKHWKTQGFLNKIRIILNVGEMFLFALIFEPYLLKSFFKSNK